MLQMSCHSASDSMRRKPPQLLQAIALMLFWMYCLEAHTCPLLQDAGQHDSAFMACKPLAALWHNRCGNQARLTAVDMLLCRNWVESVRWVIFDEVHCISELGGGDIWERLLLAVR
jgi:hypothetical protein